MKTELRETLAHGGTISREEILARLEDRSLVILNVMPKETFADRHIPGSINLPIVDVETRARQLIANFNQEIAVYCAGATWPLGLQAVGLLEGMGYTKVRHYVGGMADWLQHGAAVEKSAALIEAPPVRSSARQNIRRRLSWLEILANWPLERLVGFWVGMIIVFGVAYWLAGIGMGWGLQAGNAEVKPDLNGFATAIYFSFVTALSIGYGDVIPLGALRVLAVVEGIAGLLVFGCVISKLVSRRQEELTEEIHRTTFEDRLDRVRTNLHLVFSDFGLVQQLQAEHGSLPGQVLRRLESAVGVFRGELQTIHDLLYKSRVEPDEEALESLLANLVICLQSLLEINSLIVTANGQSASLAGGLKSVSGLANEICGDCVPHSYAPALKESMDQIQELARKIA